MTYTPTVWRNDRSPAINEDNLNQIELGIDEAHDHVDGDGSDHADVAANTLASHTQGTDTALGALTADIVLNKQAILVDAALSSDHTWTGPTQVITAGEELTIGEVAYLKSDGKYWLADANAPATSTGKIVMATATIAADGTGVVLLPSPLSFFRDDSTTEWTVTAAGDEMYLGLTAGELTNSIAAHTTATNIIRVAGYMETATVLNFTVGESYVEYV